jgi:hypothetical protein
MWGHCQGQVDFYRYKRQMYRLIGIINYQLSEYKHYYHISSRLLLPLTPSPRYCYFLSTCYLFRSFCVSNIWYQSSSNPEHSTFTMDAMMQLLLDEMALMEARITDAIEGRSSLSDTEVTVGSHARNIPDSVVADLAADHLFGGAFGLDNLTPMAAQAPSAKEVPQPKAEVVASSESEPATYAELAAALSKCSTIDLNCGIYSVPNPVLHRQHLLRDCDDNQVGVDVDILPTSEFDEGPIFDEEPCFHRSLLDSDPDSPYDLFVPVLSSPCDDERIIALSSDCTATNSFRVGSCDDNLVRVKQSSVDTQSLRTASSAGEFEAPYRDRREQPRRNEALDVVCELYRDRHEQTHGYETPDAPSFSSGIDDDIDVVEELHIPVRAHQKEQAHEFERAEDTAPPSHALCYDPHRADVPTVHSALKVFDQMSSRGSDASPGFRDLVFLVASASSSCSVEDERPKVPSSIGNDMHLVSRFLSSRLDGGVKKPS